MAKKSKEKTEARALQASTGRSYEACLNALRKFSGDYQLAYNYLTKELR